MNEEEEALLKGIRDDYEDYIATLEADLALQKKVIKLVAKYIDMNVSKRLNICKTCNYSKDKTCTDCWISHFTKLAEESE